MTWRPSSINSTCPRPRSGSAAPGRGRRAPGGRPSTWRPPSRRSSAWQSSFAHLRRGRSLAPPMRQSSIECRWRCVRWRCCSPLLLLLPVLTLVHRHRLRVTAGVAIPPHPHGRYRWPIPARHRLGRPLAGRVAAGLLPPPRRAGAGRGRDRGHRHLAGQPRLPVRLRLRVGAVGREHAAPRPVPGPRRHPPAAHSRPAGRCLADPRGGGGAAGRALAHRRRPGARRQGGPGAARARAAPRS